METEPQREPLAEIPLLGGQLTPGIVRRPAKGNAAFVHDLLLFLEDQGFPFAPRFFGTMARSGRTVVPSYPMLCWSKRPGPSGAIMMSRLDQGFPRAGRLLPITNWDHTIPILRMGTSPKPMPVRNKEVDRWENR